MKTKEQQAKEYAESVPFYQDRKQHAAEDFIAGWDAALRHLATIPFDELLNELTDFINSNVEDNRACKQKQ